MQQELDVFTRRPKQIAQDTIKNSEITTSTRSLTFNQRTFLFNNSILHDDRMTERGKNGREKERERETSYGVATGAPSAF